MNFTKDNFFNVRYDSIANRIYIKKTKIEVAKEFLYKNKILLSILTMTTSLIVVNIFLIAKFIEMIEKI